MLPGRIIVAFPGSGTYTVGFSGPPESPDGASDVGSNGEPVTFNGVVITDRDRDFVSASIVSDIALPGLDASRVTVARSSIYINFMGLYNTPGVSQVDLAVRVFDPASNLAPTFVGASTTPFDLPEHGDRHQRPA